MSDLGSVFVSEDSNIVTESVLTTNIYTPSTSLQINTSIELFTSQLFYQSTDSVVQVSKSPADCSTHFLFVHQTSRKEEEEHFIFRD